MQTPAGVECRFYYEDFNRGREIQECRLIQGNPASAPWQPGLCRTCPVPDILRANGCPNMVLTARVGRRWLLFEQVRVDAFCTLAQEKVSEPKVGCGRCQQERWKAIVEGLGQSSEERGAAPDGRQE
jgi:hypothetical protein